MDSDNENLLEDDPDYIKNNSSEKIKEENEGDHSPNSGKFSEVYSLLSGIFNEELLKRQQQLEDIENKIRSAQKTLHLMRYVQITSYYKKSLDIATNENTNINYDNQNRIHPALKKLLGGNSQLDIFTSGKRRIASKVCDMSETSTSQTSATKKKKLENKLEAPKTKSEDENKKTMRNRRKTQHRIIIGNISKWMPSSEEDNTTHKWKMYVRGDKETPDVSNIVDKVIFYLHSSYKPHDIVPVEKPPFHLSRRGWGEFPLKVEIFFKCSLNKPISIVHNLKLDKRCTGRQTLGNETVVDVDLYDDIESSKSDSITEPQDESSNISSNNFLVLDSPMEIEECNIDNKQLCNFDSKLAQHSILESLYAPPDFTQHDSAFSETCSLFDRSDSTVTNSHSDSVSVQFDSVSIRSNEHDYCQDIDIVEEQFVFNETETRNSSFLEYFNFEHSYCSPVEWDNPNHRCENLEKFTIDKNVHDETHFIFGLDDTYLNDGIRPLVNALHLPSQNASHSSRLPLPDSYGDTKSNSLEYSMKPLASTFSYESRYKVTIPQNKFKSIGEALPFLLKRFPLWNELAENEEYKTMYPFVATSQEEFEKWNIGKRLNSEWNRAKELKKILLERLPMVEKWNTKAFFMYARSHGYYCPLKNMTTCFQQKDSAELSLIDNCFSETLPCKLYTGKRNESDDSISKADASPSSPHRCLIDISDPTLKNHCSFIRETALDYSIVLTPEELEEGVVMNGAERMILEAVKCLAEGLIRRSIHHSIRRYNGFSITKYEVEKALNDRTELQLLKNA